MQDKFNLRFPDGMRDAIAERAKANGRSMNSEIVQILDDALNSNAVKWADLPDDEDIEKALTQLTPEVIEKMTNEHAAEVKESLLVTAKGISLELSKHNGYLNKVMDAIIYFENKKPT
jgi:plasmid stability protein